MSEAGAEGSLLSHLVELRRRLLFAVLGVLLVFAAIVPFADRLFEGLARPLMSVLPAGNTMIATQVAAPFLTPFKLALVAAIFITMPWILHQVWAFVAPGLYTRERMLGVGLLVSSVLLFYLGLAFAYFAVFPLVFAFFTGHAPAGVAVMTDMSQFLDFALTLFFAFGLAFEVPVATVLMVKAGMTTPARLARARPYVLLGAFTLGMFLTPPDVISQTLLAVPMYLLYEVGILMARLLVPGIREVEAQERAREDENSGD